MLRLMEITPVTLESRADHTYRVYSSQDYAVTSYGVDLTGFILSLSVSVWTCHRSAAAGAASIDLAWISLTCWDAPDETLNPASRSPHAAPGRLLFLVSIAVGLYRAWGLS
jgi:hypothetical protein